MYKDKFKTKYLAPICLFVFSFLLYVNPVFAVISEPGFESQVVASGFSLPTSVAFAPDGRIFVAEKGGAIKVIKNGSVLATPLLVISDLNTFGDRGLLSIAVDPNFETNGYIYASYTYENSPGINISGTKTGRIVRFTVVGDTALESSKQVILGTVGGNAVTGSCEDFPITSDCIPSDSMSHSMGGLKFGPDGFLYATFGDGSNFDGVDPRALRSQNIDSLAGKMVRINADGTAPSTNPFFDGDPNSNKSKVFAYGFRNAFRFNFNPINGNLFAGDVGWNNFEEVNLVLPGSNFGWPCREGVSTTTYGCNVVNYVDPVYYYGHNANGAGSITVGAFPSNSAYPIEYNNSFFVGDYAQNWIKRVVIDGQNLVSVFDFMDNPDGPVDIVSGLDGNVYYLSIYTGELHKITHTSGNRTPVPVVSATPSSGLVPLVVGFSSSGSYDPDGESLIYEWNFGDGQVSNDPNPTHSYEANGNYNAFLQITDPNGASASKNINIQVGNQKPIPQITNPTNGSLYFPGQTVNVAGIATDPEDGQLNPSTFNWQIILHHNTHIHIIQQFSGIDNPSFIMPDHGDSSVYIEIKFTATDSGNLSDSRSINVYMNSANNSGNLIVNPSMEEENLGGGTPVGWVKGGYGVNDAVFTYPAPGFDGLKSAKLDVSAYSNGDAKWFFSPVFVVPGQKYIFSDYYVSNVESNQSVQFGLPNGTYQYLFLGSLPSTTTPTKVERIITVPDGVQTMTVFHSLSQNGSLTVDNYSLVADTASSTPTPIVKTPIFSSNFESNNFSEWNNQSNNNFELSGGTCRLGNDINLSAVKITGTNTPHNQILQKTLPTTGYENLALVFCYKWDVLEDGDGVALEYTTDGVNWNLLKDINNSTVRHMMYASDDTEIAISNGVGQIPTPINTSEDQLAEHSIAFPSSASNNPNFAFRIREHMTDGNDFVWMDDFKILGVATTSIVVPPVSTSTNLIQNPSLESAGTNGDPSNWFRGGWGTNTRTFTYPVAGNTTAKAARVEITSYTNGDAKWYFSDVPVVASTTYNFSNSYRSSVASNLTARFTRADNTVYYSGIANLPVSANWTDINYDITIPSDAVSVTIFHNISGVGFLETDNFSLKTGSLPLPPPPTPTNLIQNPSLESAGTNGDPSNWFRGGWGTNTRTFTYPVAGNTTTKAAKVEITSYTNGDAKWYFSDVPVVAGNTYTISHSYKSNITSGVTIRYTKSDGTTQYLWLSSLVASANWTEHSHTFVVPAGVVSMTLFHTISGVGFLDVDQFSLTSGSPTSNPDNFANGLVSLSFDDGWLSQYVSALPILNLSNIKGTFYIISEETRLAVPDERIQNPSLESAGTNGDPSNWFRGGWGTNTRTFTYPVAGNTTAKAAKVEITSYTNGDAKWYFADSTVIPNQEYKIVDKYNSNATSQVVARYTFNDNTVQYLPLATLASTGGVWQTFEKNVIMPANIKSVTIFHLISRVGYLVVDDYSLKRTQIFVDPSQMLQMQSFGHEIGAHTKTHANLPTLTTVQKEDEINGSKTSIMNMGITSVSTIAYPYGAYDVETKSITQSSGFTAGRSVDRGFNTKTTDKFALKIQQVDRTTTIADIQGWVNQAIADKVWLILMFHQIDSDITADLGITPAFLQQIVNYINSTSIQTITVKEGVSLMNP